MSIISDHKKTILYYLNLTFHLLFNTRSLSSTRAYLNALKKKFHSFISSVPQDKIISTEKLAFILNYNCECYRQLYKCDFLFLNIFLQAENGSCWDGDQRKTIWKFENLLTCESNGAKTMKKQET